jgi:hypothetical protein
MFAHVGASETATRSPTDLVGPVAETSPPGPVSSGGEDPAAIDHHLSISIAASERERSKGRVICAW